MTGLSDRSIQDDPFAYYTEQRSQCPVWHESDIDLYVVGAMAEARAVLTDATTFSNKPAHRGSPGNQAAAAYFTTLSERGWARAVTLQRTDPPVHTKYRKILNRVFTPARVRVLTPGIDDIVRELTEPLLERGTCEFVTEFALPLPGMFIAEQLGLDRTDYRRFRRWADAMLCFANRPDLTLDEAMVHVEHELDAQHHLAGAVEARRGQPTEDLLSLVANARHEGESAAPGEVGEYFSMNEMQDVMHQLVTGGFETTTAGLSTAMHLLVTHPDQQELLRAEPELLTNFVEEALRVDSPVQGLWRQTTCPVHVAGIDIEQGKSVHVRYGAANRDPLVFTEPDRFDITRGNAKEHVAFGLGAHFCLGAALARQEMISAFQILLDRTTWIDLAEPVPTPMHEPSFFLRPMKELHLRLTVA